MKNIWDIPTILLLTTRPKVRSIVKTAFNKEFHIIEENHPLSAIESAKATILDYIIIDSQIEDIKPLDTCKQIRRFTYAPIILISDILKKSYHKKATVCGVNEFISEHFDQKELLFKLQECKNKIHLQEKTKKISKAISKHKEVFSSLKNKFFLNPQTIKSLQKSTGKQEPITILIIKINSYEKIEKKIGSLEMRKLFETIFEEINNNLCKENVSFPDSSNNIIIIMPNTNNQQAKKRAISLKQAIFNLSLATIENNNISLSIAISSFKNATESLEKIYESFDQIISVADKALKKEKNQTLILDQENYQI